MSTDHWSAPSAIHQVPPASDATGQLSLGNGVAVSAPADIEERVIR